MQHPLVQALGEVLRAPGSASVHVRGLGVADIARYFEAVTGATPAEAFVRRISVETGGNPFFLGEVARLLAAEPQVADALTVPIPLGVRAVVARRLQALRPPARQMLALAAVLGREFSAGTLQAVGAALKLGPQVIGRSTSSRRPSTRASPSRCRARSVTLPVPMP